MRFFSWDYDMTTHSDDTLSYSINETKEFVICELEKPSGTSLNGLLTTVWLSIIVRVMS